MNSNKIQPKITGQFKDTIKYKDGRVEVKEGQNLIVDGIFKLMTSLLADSVFKLPCYFRLYFITIHIMILLSFIIILV